MTSSEITGVSGLTILGYALIVLGIVAGIGGVAVKPEHGWAYAIGGLIVATAGAAIVQGLPMWVPLTLLWATVAVIGAYLVVSLHSQPYLLAVSAVVVVAAGVFFTWLIARH